MGTLRGATVLLFEYHIWHLAISDFSSSSTKHIDTILFWAGYRSLLFTHFLGEINYNLVPWVNTPCLNSLCKFKEVVTISLYTEVNKSLSFSEVRMNLVPMMGNFLTAFSVNGATPYWCSDQCNKNLACLWGFTWEKGHFSCFMTSVGLLHAERHGCSSFPWGQ